MNLPGTAGLRPAAPPNPPLRSLLTYQGSMGAGGEESECSVASAAAEGHTPPRQRRESPRRRSAAQLPAIPHSGAWAFGGLVFPGCAAACPRCCPPIRGDSPRTGGKLDASVGYTKVPPRLVRLCGFSSFSLGEYVVVVVDHHIHLTFLIAFGPRVFQLTARQLRTK